MERKIHRRSVRLPGYDYSQPGAYFVTICSFNRKCIFGNIEHGEMILNDVGIVIRDAWLQIPKHYSYVELDCSIVMPNHIHGILMILDKSKDRRATLASIIKQYKGHVQKQIDKTFTQKAIRVWQRNYYEHIVRNEKSLFDIREYIANNPLKWEMDRNNPKFL